MRYPAVSSGMTQKTVNYGIDVAIYLHIQVGGH